MSGSNVDILALDAADVLHAANFYTVKVRRISSIGLNEDRGTSTEATGFLVDRKRGWIVTNAHVASRSPAVLSLSFKGHAYLPARRLFVDRFSDVAILAVDSLLLPTTALEAQLDCGRLPRVGTSVAIFGHPGDFSYTATRGIVSSVSWIFPGEMIQSDAAVNGGNSGGPMIDLATGKVIGIAAATYRDTEDKYSTATSMSEPIPPVCQILELLKAGKDARYRQLPVALASAEDDDRPIVARVLDEASGFELGDLILTAGGRDIRNMSDLAAVLRGQTQAVPIMVERNGSKVELKAKAEASKDVLAARSIDLSGLIISEPWKLDQAELGADRLPVIDFVRPGSPAALIRAYPGYQLVSVDRKSFTNLEDLYGYLVRLPQGASVSLILKASYDDGRFYHQYFQAILPAETIELISPS
ncbi:trypsin-like peptidase domain-containing protein [Sandarakinorhabdus limnophila]|uniref:trypsin-like peptidase domain-containing protein n=1 Tax=Sandarakinorhabdus limnophila TaxID=210512 RepID=UPI0026EF82F0|nr:trypsin-like peptidase domain-containing protein [Sandarakinorhabdus limnophila]MCM0032773.1 trypsin-like peptidase domain-containing protein [Sandarakinorhabdus limnophila]